MNYWLLLIPFLSAILGWLGTRIAIKLFLYNILPARLAKLAEKIGKTVYAEFSFADLEKKISDPENIKKVMPLVEEHIDDFLRNKLKQKMPVVGMFIGDKTINSLKEVFLKEIEDLFPHVLKKFEVNIQTELDIETLVTNKITAVSSERLEKMLSPALKYFQLTGAITGLIIGVINLIIFLAMK
jgi:uncharacterized membrane protein YheB (UPF0754 family)